MRTTILISLFLVISFSCSLDKKNPGEDISLREYFASSSRDVEIGGVKMIPVHTPAGDFRVWTKRFGNNPKIKVLLLHGGPGATHEYFECMESFLPAEGIEFIYYDQLGSPSSDQPTDSSLWMTDRFVEEVEQVRQALFLDKNNFYLLGHSWGGILAIEYVMKYQDNLKGLIISNMMASGPAYGKYADEVLAKQMDPSVLDTIRMLEEKGDFNNPKYMELLLPNFYTQHIMRIPLDKWPEPVTRSFSKMNQQVYIIMQGPSEFGISGRLAKWDRSQDLKNIRVPTLVVGATFDTMDPEYMKWMSSQIPGSTFLLCPNGSHMCMYDDQETYMNGLISFLKDSNKKSMAH